jgi:hypothetical protein
MYPLAMIHMAMPVTRRAWINLQMASTFFKNVAPTIYFWIIWLATGLIVIIPPAVLGVISVAAFGSKFNDLARRLIANKPPSGAIDWVILSLAIVIVIVYAFGYGFAAVFKARAIGLLALYFKDSLDLVVLVAEKEYKRQEILVDKWGNKIKSTQQKVAEVIGVILLIALVTGVGFWVYYLMFKKH